MKKTTFLILGLLFFLFIVDRGASLIIDFFYEDIKYGQSVGDINYYLSKDKNPDCLFLGSSRVRRHIIPDSFSLNTFVLAHDGMYLQFNTGLVSILKDNGKLPKRIVLNIEPYFFSNDINNNKLHNQAKYLRYFYNKNEFVTNYINDISKTERFKYLFKLYRFNGIFASLPVNYIKSKWSPPTHKGFFPLAYNPADTAIINRYHQKDKMTNKDVEAAPNSDVEVATNTAAFKYLDDLLGLLEDTDTEIVFITAPNYREETYPKIAQKLKTYIEGKRKVYWDYCNQIDVPTIRNKENWKDLDHMNINGAKVFTSDLKKRLNKL